MSIYIYIYESRLKSKELEINLKNHLPFKFEAAAARRAEKRRRIAAAGIQRGRWKGSSRLESKREEGCATELVTKREEGRTEGEVEGAALFRIRRFG